MDPEKSSVQRGKALAWLSKNREEGRRRFGALLWPICIACTHDFAPHPRPLSPIGFQRRDASVASYGFRFGANSSKFCPGRWKPYPSVKSWITGSGNPENMVDCIHRWRGTIWCLEFISFLCQRIFVLFSLFILAFGEYHKFKFGESEEVLPVMERWCSILCHVAVPNFTFGFYIEKVAFFFVSLFLFLSMLRLTWGEVHPAIFQLIMNREMIIPM